MNPVIQEYYEQFEKLRAGAICPVRDKDGRIANLILNCPGCGAPGSMAIRPTTPGESHPSWEMTGFPEAITLKPSINCVDCCGWHGWLTNGIYSKC